MTNQPTTRPTRGAGRVPAAAANGHSTGPMLDLDARRAEEHQEPLTIKVNGQRFTLPSRLTLATLRSMGRVATLTEASTPEEQAEVLPLLDALIVDLFGDQAEEASKVIHVTELRPILEFYGVSVGESLASGAR